MADNLEAISNDLLAKAVELDSERDRLSKEQLAKDDQGRPEARRKLR